MAKKPTIKPMTPPKLDTKVSDFARKGTDRSNYYAWKTASGKKPDFGKGSAGPGTPYREVKKNYKVIPGKQGGKPTSTLKPPTSTIKNPPRRPSVGNWVIPRPKPGAPIKEGSKVNPPTFGNDLKTQAIRRRLNGAS